MASCWKLLQQIIGLALVHSFLVSCSTLAVTSRPVPSTPTSILALEGSWTLYENPVYSLCLHQAMGILTEMAF